LEQEGYEYIIGARIKNEEQSIKEKILAFNFYDGQIRSIKRMGLHE
jgi:hypothetical protein